MSKRAYQSRLSANPLYADCHVGSGGNAGGKFLFEAAGGETIETTAYRRDIVRLEDTISIVRLEDGVPIVRLENG